MAFGSIELTTISRAQDYTTIKHNEDNKVNVDQANFSQQLQKTPSGMRTGPTPRRRGTTSTAGTAEGTVRRRQPRNAWL